MQTDGWTGRQGGKHYIPLFNALFANNAQKDINCIHFVSLWFFFLCVLKLIFRFLHFVSMERNGDRSWSFNFKVLFGNLTVGTE